MKFLCAAIGAAFLVGCTTDGAHAGAGVKVETEFSEVFAPLLAGGYAIVVRHANSPAGQMAPVGMTDGCVLGDGRGLDAEGLYQARYTGEWLKASDVPILKAYTSDMCRSWDTARLMAGKAPVFAHPAQKTTDPEIIAAFKAEIETELAANPGQNIMLVSHSNVAPLYGATAQTGEAEIPSGGVFVVRPPAWDVLVLRVDLTVNPDPQTVTVD